MNEKNVKQQQQHVEFSFTIHRFKKNSIAIRLYVSRNVHPNAIFR